LADGTDIYRKGIILKMYEENGLKPLWSSISILSLADAISVLQHDGLNPADYQFDKISKFLKDPSQKPQSLEEEVTVDILLTEAYLRALYSLNYGKVDPELLDADHNYTQQRPGASMAAKYLSWIQQGRVDAAFDWARPKSKRYQLLKSALAHYLQLQNNGG
jgi:murein L,D-transpeptidase YcbB/YkuD